MFADPLFNDIGTLNTSMATYNEAMNNSKALENARDTLTAKENAINPDNLIKIKKLLPDNVDNIRLILEIEQIALPYGMVLKDVKYNATSTTNNTTGTPAAGAPVAGGASSVKQASKDYGIFDLEFSTSGTYDNFINFTKDLESNLRIVDISSIAFSSDTNTNANTKIISEVYQYDFKIKTYYLKN
jgi:Tfp pilus assembly protein PilO